MKKFCIAGLTMVLLFVLALSAVGCSSSDDEIFKAFTDGFNAAVDVTSLEQSIEVKNDNLLVYSLEKSYRKGESGYSVTGEEKKLNELGEFEAYTVTIIEDTVKKADTFTTSIKLSEEAFDQYEIKGGKLTASVRDVRVEEVLGLSGNYAEMQNVTLEMTLDGDKINSFNVTFKSGSYDVQILLTFAYE